MLVGLIADSHDNLPMVNKTLEKLNEKHVQLTLHAGDYVAPFVIPIFSKSRAKIIGVFGNNDGDRELLKRRFSEYKNLDMRGNFANISVEDLKIALLHGNEKELLDTVISESFDIVVHGHTHKAEIHQKGKTLVVNPGEVCGYLSGRSTIALLDTNERQAKIVEL